MSGCEVRVLLSVLLYVCMSAYIYKHCVVKGRL